MNGENNTNENQAGVTACVPPLPPKPVRRSTNSSVRDALDMLGEMSHKCRQGNDKVVVTGVEVAALTQCLQVLQARVEVGRAYEQALSDAVKEAPDLLDEPMQHFLHQNFAPNTPKTVSRPPSPHPVPHSLNSPPLPPYPSGSGFPNLPKLQQSMSGHFKLQLNDSRRSSSNSCSFSSPGNSPPSSPQEGVPVPG
eukprot:CAMPEP_0113940192 /NCGR_PEP_ID=MMETSP1339-20121228/6365_1 /TAXON_ID=94617 /ORGANISM="Fibrocapsa japonica" /LENGTH=194 /DNA_ID=CAMNT_0000943919 /DNA_START=102 /DNA_END=682 /DNA_ORIENTATION=+ /assembly_acc=CAM_ASM_000762